MRQARCRGTIRKRAAHRNQLFCPLVAEAVGETKTGVIFKCSKGHTFNVSNDEISWSPEGELIERSVKPRAVSTQPFVPDEAPTNGQPIDVQTLRDRAHAGATDCGGCGGKTTLYKRKLNSGIAYIICWLTANRGLEWTHVGEMSRECSTSNEISRLVHWGFAEEKPGHSEAKKTSGVWRATPAGVAFAREEADAPSHAFVQSPGNRLFGMEETKVTVLEALGDRFDYVELMRGDG